MKKLTLKQAKDIRRMRVDDGYSWRAIAHECYDKGYLGGDWYPKSNQLMGMSLCEMASKFFNENYMEEPWN